VAVEVHALGAIVKPANNAPSQAEVMIWKPGVLQITAKHGDLAFLYRREFQVLPGGDTYRIYLGGDKSGAEAVTGGGGGKIWGANKILLLGERLRQWPPGGSTTLSIREAE